MKTFVRIFIRLYIYICIILVDDANAKLGQNLDKNEKALDPCRYRERNDRVRMQLSYVNS